MDIEKVILEIKAEALQRSKSAPHPDYKKLKGGSLRLRPKRDPIVVRGLSTLKREKLGAFRRLYKLPGIGYALKWSALIIRLPKRIAQMNQDIADLNSRLYQTEMKIQSLDLENYLLKITDWVQRENDIVRKSLDVNSALTERHNKMTLENRSQIAELMAKRQAAVTTSNPTAQPSIPMDNFYLEFENRFRGTQEQIHNKLEKYVSKLSARNTSKQAPILDIGCGRGEWLRILKDNGYPSQGIDLNHFMVEECKGKSLNAELIDALSYLKAQPSDSHSAITAFHVVEHLNFQDLLRLLDESLRVLEPNGTLILETPNPENLIVGACNFYTDPTHLNPIPPHSLAFYVQQRGFREIDVLRLSPVKDGPFSDDPVVNDLAQWFYREQDYAIIAQK